MGLRRDLFRRLGKWRKSGWIGSAFWCCGIRVNRFCILVLWERCSICTPKCEESHCGHRCAGDSCCIRCYQVLLSPSTSRTCQQVGWAPTAARATRNLWRRNEASTRFCWGWALRLGECPALELSGDGFCLAAWGRSLSRGLSWFAKTNGSRSIWKRETEMQNMK